MSLPEARGRRRTGMPRPYAEQLLDQDGYPARRGSVASPLYAPKGFARERLEHPRAFAGDGWVDTSWEDALALYAGLVRKVLDTDGPDGLLFDTFDQYGAGAGFENAWGVGKLLYAGLGARKVWLQGRLACDAECQASRDMGVREHNSSYQDAEVADTLVAIGSNPAEGQANGFLAHWLPNLRGATRPRKEERFPGEPAEPARIVFVDPRRTPSVELAEAVAGKDRVLHLDLAPGTDGALFNGLLTYVVERDWHDPDFIAARTRDFARAFRANRLPLEEAARITGLPVARIQQAAHWMFAPRAGGARPRTMLGYDRGILWGSGRYAALAALVDLALATHNVGRRGTGVARLGARPEAYPRPPCPGPRPAMHITEEVALGNGRMLTLWGCTGLQPTRDGAHYRQTLQQRGEAVREALARTRGSPVAERVEATWDALRERGGLFVTSVDLYPAPIGHAAHLLLPAARPGEMHLTALNGERRLRLAELFMDPPGTARPDCLIAAAIARALRALYDQDGNAGMASRFAGFDWKTEEDVFRDGAHRLGVAPGHDPGTRGSDLVTYARLRAMGRHGVQVPVTAYRDGRLVGTERLYADGRFDTADGKARFLPAPWTASAPPVVGWKARLRFWR